MKKLYFPYKKYGKFAGEMYAIPKEYLCFTTRNFVATGLPIKKPKNNEFKRQNNLVTTNMMTPKDIGLPYGKIPRLAIIEIVTHIFKTKKRTMYIGSCNREHYEKLGLNPNTSGKFANQKNNQLNRLLNCAFYIQKEDKNGQQVEEKRFFIAKRNTKIDINKIQEIEFSDEFYKYVLDKRNIVPINKKHLTGLSAFQMDLYISLSYWLCYLEKRNRTEVVITYEMIQKQFALEVKELRYLKRCLEKNIGRIENNLFAKVNLDSKGIRIKRV